MPQIIPLFAPILLLYFGFCTVDVFPANLDKTMLVFDMPSGIAWKPTYGDLLLAIGLVALFLEIYRSTRTTDTGIIEHIMSTFVLIAYLICFLIYPWATNSYILLLTMMSFMDVIAGFTVTVVAARRDIELQR